MKHHRKASILRALVICGGVLLSDLSAMAQKSSERKDVSQDDQEKQTCRKNLLQIHRAIQDFRKDHKELPNWLSDLLPQFISETNILVCPVNARTGRKHSFEDFADPRSATAYIYQFSAGRALTAFEPTEGMTHADVKRLQMALIGGGTPILSCALHSGGWIHVGFDGDPYETKEEWEKRYFDVVLPAELASTRRVIEKFGKAFDTLTKAAKTNVLSRQNGDAKESSGPSSSAKSSANWPWWAYVLGAGGGFYLFAAGGVKLFSLVKSR